MEYDKVIEYLYSIDRKKGSRLGLKNVKYLLRKIGNPHKGLKAIHVAGTNGKGSVSAMISSILACAGYKIGTYTSPHLTDFRERFVINDRKISKKDVVKYFRRIKKHITNQTFFEIITAIAFLYFKDNHVDFAVLEVGMGGRLDATNVIKPLISIITNIDLEHTKVLGDTISEIAGEKAGIIKKDAPCVTGARGKALNVIRKICKENNSKLFLNKRYEKNNGTYNINNYKNLKLSLKGEFQLENSTIAVTAIDVLNKYYDIGINKDHIKKGLNDTKWRGRFEFISKNMLVDCAHNPAGMRILAEELKKVNKDYDKIMLVIGILKDKNIKKMLGYIEPLADHIILTKASSGRAEEPKVIMQLMKDKTKLANCFNDVKSAVKYSKKVAKKKDLIVIAGSCYIIGEVLFDIKQ